MCQKFNFDLYAETGGTVLINPEHEKHAHKYTSTSANHTHIAGQHPSNLRVNTDVRMALREGCEIQPSVVNATLERRWEGHQRRLHVVQRPFHQTLMILHIYNMRSGGGVYS